MGQVQHHEFVIEHGEDVWVYTRDGRRLLDATASLWYANIGHGRSEIGEAVARQMAKLEAYGTFGEFATPPTLELAERLSGLAPMPDARIFLGSGGGDAIDSAAKIARRYWHLKGQAQKTVLLTRSDAYHGTHGFGTSLAGIPANREGMGPMIETIGIVDKASSDGLREAIARIGADNIAAFFAEPVIGAGGVHPPAPGYLETVAAICREADILFVADAVICGFGRLGTWFGVERWDLEPDLITFAKGVTSGYLPLGGVVVSSQVAEPFFADGAPPFRHGQTYAGHAACCVAALVNIDILEREELVPRGRTMEQPLLDALQPLQRFSAVSEVRGGVGLLAAVELDPDLRARNPLAVVQAANATREAGVLVRPLGTSLAISPPLTATPEHFEYISQALATGIETVDRAVASAA